MLRIGRNVCVELAEGKTAERKVIFPANPIPDENNPGRIVEFP